MKKYSHPVFWAHNYHMLSASRKITTISAL